MAVNKRLLQGAAAAPGGITPSEHFGVVLYEGDGSTSHSINGGKFGAGAYFRGGTSNNISLDIDFTTTKTISMWVKNNSFPAYNVHLIRPSTNNLNFGFLQSSRTVFLWDGNSTQNWGYAIPNDTNFHHIVLAIDGTNAKLYVDNDDKGSITIIANSQTQLTLGKDSATNGLDGVMDQVRIFQKQLSSSEVSTLYAETAATVESLDPLSEDTTDTLQVLGDSSCIATYRFENDEVDLSGNYNGTGVKVQYAAGRYGQAARFGNSSYVDLGTVTRTSSMTLSAWVKTTGNNLPVVFLDNGTVFRLGIDSSGYAFASNLDGTNPTSTTTVNNGSWNHIVAVFGDSGFRRIYVNSSLEDSETYSTATRTYKDGIAIDNTNPASSQIDIDQVRIFNKALSASEVTTLYNENSLVASYRFEGNANDDTRNYDGTATNVTYEYGLNFTPDLVWIKDRSATRDHNITDSTRGVTHPIYIETGAQLTNSTFLQSFDTGGFTLGNNATANEAGEDFVAWCWKANGGTTSSNTDGSITGTVQANTDAGFSIVQYDSTGNSSGTIGHGLGVKPGLAINKNIDSGSTVWVVNTDEIDGSGDYLLLNSTAAKGDAYTPPTATTIGSIDYATNDTVISYCFASIDGYSKIGTYTGNGSTNGPIVETGFEPAFLMIKRTDTADAWYMYDNKRTPSNPRNKIQLANTTDAELTNTQYYSIDFLSNGFQLKSDVSTATNDNGGSYIYMAFAADPDTEAPAVAKSFSTVAYTGDGTSNRQIDLGFKPGLYWLKTRDTSGCTYHNLFDIIRGGNKTIYSNVTSAEVTDQGCGYISSFDDNGVTYTGDASGINNNGEDFVAWAWKADDNEPTIFGGAAKAVYKFENNANDVTGTYNGTASNVTYSSSGKFNKAGNFSTSGANIAIGSPIPNTDTEVSVSAWIYLNSGATSYETVIGAGVGTSGSEAPFRVNVRYVSANTYKIEGLSKLAVHIIILLYQIIQIHLLR